jgi:hypothetical protein
LDTDGFANFLATGVVVLDKIAEDYVAIGNVSSITVHIHVKEGDVPSIVSITLWGGCLLNVFFSFFSGDS